MARNFGQHPALLCGFSHAEGDFIITMDDDLQHPPEEIPKLINTIRERDDVDVIIASYEGRKHGPIRRLGTKVSVWATSKMLGKDPNLQITSFRLIRRFLVEAMLQTNTYLPQIGNLLVLSSNRCIMMQEPTEKAVILSAVWSETCFTISLPTPHSRCFWYVISASAVFWSVWHLESFF